MQTADYTIVAFVVLSALMGVLRGFLREVIALASWILALIVAGHLTGLVEPHLETGIHDPNIRLWVARAILFFGVLLIGSVTGSLLAHFVRLSIFSGTDRFLGLVFGLLRAGVALGVLAILGQLYRLDAEHWWHESQLIPYCEKLGSAVRALVGEARGHGRSLSVIHTRTGIEPQARSN